MSEPIAWTNERRKLSQLKPWPRNPRQIKREQAERLAESFDTFGQVETIAIGADGEIYNGHQRLNVLMREHGADYEIDVRVSSRPLSEKEREKLTVFLHRGATGEWDFDLLANEFELGELLEWGFEAWEIGLGDVIGVEAGDLDKKRDTNNLGIIGKGGNVGFQLGEIMVSLPVVIYEKFLDVVNDPKWEDRRAAVMSILEGGIDAQDRVD